MENNENLEINLKDAGFNEEEIKEFIELLNNNNLFEQKQYLDEKRKSLLDKVHKSEKQIMCLDYLKYELEKDLKANKKGDIYDGCNRK